MSTEYDDYNFAKKEGKKIFIWIVMASMIISGIIWMVNRGESAVETGIIRYEEFQEIKNTCDKINTDLCNMKELSDTDVMFAQFSKAQRINALKTNLNRWVQEYNAKSNMLNHSMWKSKALPYQLDVNDFSCYNSK